MNANVEHPTSNIERPTEAKPTVYLLRVEVAGYVAGAVWKKIKGIWCCSKASRRLRWMVGWSNHWVKGELAAMGAKSVWKPIEVQPGGSMKVKR